jgi:hypothetical protein
VEIRYLSAEHEVHVFCLGDGAQDFSNIDAVQWFCDEIPPHVQERVPEANLMIFGSRPVAAVRRLRFGQFHARVPLGSP